MIWPEHWSERMAQVEDVVVALARAYSLSDLFPVEDSRVQENLREASAGIGRALILHVEEGALRVAGRGISDPDGSTGELARDLALAGVAQLHLPEGVAPERLARFVVSLREGAGAGDGVRTARELGRLSRIGVVFAESGPGRAGVGQSVASIFEKASSSAAEGDPDAGKAPGLAEGPVPPPDETTPAFGRTSRSLDEGAPASERPRASTGTAGDGVERGGDAAARVPAAKERSGLGEIVDRYLDAPVDQRSEREEELRSVAEEAKGKVEEMAAVVERLALEGVSEDGRPAALELARDLLTPGAATRLALHLGAVRDEERRDALVEASARLGEEMASALAEALVDASDRAARRTYIQALVTLGEECRPQVERMLQDRRWFVVRNGVRVLGGIGSEGDVEHLTSPLAHPDSRVRRETVRALARIGGEDAAMLLLGMLDDADADVRAAVATALGAVGRERAVKVLLQRLEREDSEKVEVQLLRALGALGDPGAVPAIEKRAVATFFSRPPRPVRIAAYRALARIGTPHAMELLSDARNDRDEQVRAVARSLLGVRGG